MENKKHIFSSLSGGETNINNGIYSNQFNNKFLNLPTLFKKTPSFLSENKRHSSTIGIKNFNHDLIKLPKLVHDTIKQYELHPYRQLNLKIIGEDIKQKLFEMNKKDNEYVSTIRKSFTSKDPNNFIKKNNKKFNLTEQNKNVLKEEKEEQYNNVETIKLCLEIPQKIPNRKKKKMTSKIIRDRRLNRAKNLYDSIDDDESGDEGDDYIINPETGIIAFFDFLIFAFFLYYFIFTTVNLCKEKCFCPLNKSGIKFSDVLLFVNDILNILDLILSFFRGYYNYNYKLITTHKLVLNNYLRHDFIFDLLSAIPISSIIEYTCLKRGYYGQCFKYEMPNKFLLLKLCSLLKATKIKKILGHKKNQALDRFIEKISENYAIERAFIILIHALKYIGIFHFFVCLHIFIGNHSYSNWLILTDAVNESFFHIYVQSLYFIITTLTTVGYGDIVCKSLLERIFQIIILAIGSVLYPYVVSLIGNFIKNDSSAKIKHNNDLALLENIRRTYPNLSFKLYNKIYKYLENKSCSFEKYDVNSLIETLPFTLKNNILFTMYKSSISNFKFFKNNNNSVFIAEVLNNFIPSISKKNDFLVYEGEMLEEIIFLKDGKISFNAAINMENPLKSINKYFFESFAAFTTAEEKKLLNENISIKSNVSTAGEITYDKAKNQLNNAFKNIDEEKNVEEKSQFKIQTNIKKETFDFDIKGGAIINDEGNYQYLRILDIRKNEHFGQVFMTLNKPCPLSLQVKSKMAELFLLKKEHAVNLSKSYPNIWRKIYGREFHNLRKIKQYTFIALKKYMEINDLLLMNNIDIDDFKLTNNLSSFDINLFDKSGIVDKSIRKSNIHKSFLSKKEELGKNNTLNYVYDKKVKKLNLDKIKVNIKSKMNKKFDVKRNSTFDNQKNITQSNSNSLNLKSGSFFSSNYNSNKTGNNKNIVNNVSNFQANLKLIKYNNEKKNEEKKEKLKNLKLFLIEYKKSLMNNENQKEEKSYRSNNENNNLSIPKVPIKKSCLKKRSPETTKYNKLIIKSNKSIKSLNKNVAFDLGSNKEDNSNNKNNINEKLLKNLNDICEKETNFSFCSMEEKNNSKFKELSVFKNSDFAIISSYPNLNEITKGKYHKDINFQKKLKYILKNYYKYKNMKKESNMNINNSNVQETLFPSDLENSLNSAEFDKKNHKIKLRKKKQFSKSHKVKTFEKEKYSSFSGTNKLNKMNNRKKIIDEIKFNRTEIRNRNNLATKKFSTDDLEIYNNLEIVSTLKIENKNISDNPSKSISDLNSVKANKNLDSSSDKKSAKKDYDDNSNKNFVNKNIKVDSKIDNDKDKRNNKSNNHSNQKTDYSIYKKRKKKNSSKSRCDDKDKELINKMLGIKIPNNKNTNNIITTSSNLKDNKNDFNSVEKIKNIENVSIYNIIQKNINKNFNIIDKNEKDSSRNNKKSLCYIM